MVDITKFFIITQDQFDSVLQYLNCDLNIYDKNYFSAYIMANFFGYFVIFMSFYVILTIYFKLFARKKGML